MKNVKTFKKELEITSDEMLELYDRLLTFVTPALSQFFGSMPSNKISIRELAHLLSVSMAGNTRFPAYIKRLYDPLSVKYDKPVNFLVHRDLSILSSFSFALNRSMRDFYSDLPYDSPQVALHLIYETIIYFATELNYDIDTPYPIIDIANFKRNFEKSIMNQLYNKHLEEK